VRIGPGQLPRGSQWCAHLSLAVRCRVLALHLRLFAAGHLLQDRRSKHPSSITFETTQLFWGTKTSLGVRAERSVRVVALTNTGRNNKYMLSALLCPARFCTPDVVGGVVILPFMSYLV
jgi:hypothetical protein